MFKDLRKRIYLYISCCTPDGISFEHSVPVGTFFFKRFFELNVKLRFMTPMFIFRTYFYTTWKLIGIPSDHHWGEHHKKPALVNTTDKEARPGREVGADD